MKVSNPGCGSCRSVGQMCLPASLHIGSSDLIVPEAPADQNHEAYWSLSVLGRNNLCSAHAAAIPALPNTAVAAGDGPKQADGGNAFISTSSLH